MVRLSWCVCFVPFVICFARPTFFAFSLWCHTLAGVPSYQYAFNSKTPTMTAAVAVPMSTYGCCCCSSCCTDDLQHSPPWLLLLLFVVDRLVSVTLCCSFVIAINQLMRLYKHMLEGFQFRLTSSIFILRFDIFSAPSTFA